MTQSKACTCGETDDARRIGRIRKRRETSYSQGGHKADHLLARNNKSVRQQNRSVLTESKVSARIETQKETPGDRCNQVKCADKTNERWIRSKLSSIDYLTHCNGWPSSRGGRRSVSTGPRHHVRFPEASDQGTSQAMYANKESRGRTDCNE